MTERKGVDKHGAIADNWQVAKIPTVPKTAKQLALEKERRLRRQYQEQQQQLKKFPADTFKANRFGPLAFALAFGLAGAYFAVSSFASPQIPARSPQLAIEPATNQVARGETLRLRIWSDSLDKPVSSVLADIEFPADKLAFVSMDTTDSAFSQDVASSASAGTVTLSRSTSDPSGLAGRQYVGEVTFRALESIGQAEVGLGTDSRMLRSGDNADILQQRGSGRYYISVIQ